MDRMDALYGRLPVWAQHGAFSAYGAYGHWLHFGPGYRSSAAACGPASPGSG